MYMWSIKCFIDLLPICGVFDRSLTYMRGLFFFQKKNNQHGAERRSSHVAREWIVITFIDVQIVYMLPSEPTDIETTQRTRVG